MYNLTKNQQEILRWIVEKVREGNLAEEFSFVYLASGDIKFLGRGIKDVSDHPYISQGTLSALKESNLILFDNNESSFIHCTLLGKAYDAVDSNFDTTNFPSGNVIHVEQMIGSQIQQGSIHSPQTLTYTNNDIEVILKFISDLRSKLHELKLDTNIQAEVESEIGTLESQIKSPRPKFAVIKECLMSLRTILEGMAGNVIASLLVQQISNLH